MIDLTWLTDSPAGRAIGWAVLHSFWQLSLIALILRALLQLIPQRKPEIRYVVLLASLIVAVGWAGYTLQANWQEETTLSANPKLSLETGLTTTPEVEQVTAPPQDLLGKARRLMQELDSHTPLISICWMIGTFFFTLYLLIGLFYIKYLEHSRVSLPSENWEERLRELCRKMGIRRKVRLYLSERVKSPITFQVFRPVILLPVSVFSGLSPAQIEVLLLHELAHIRRYDFAVNLLQSIIEIIFFYHPAVWWICGKIRDEREYACDRAVMKVQDDPFPYVEALTQVQSFHFSIKNKLVMSANANKSLLSKRVYRLLGHYDREPVRYKSVFFACLLLLFFSAQAFVSLDNLTLPPEADALVGMVQDTTPKNGTPLFVVDGEVKDWTSPSDDELQPASIEKINVLKGQQAIDLYGEKGRNGVIEITTKGAASKDTENTPPAPVQMENKLQQPQSGSPIIKGVVQDEAGHPMIGANIIVKGTTVGTVVDMEGNFQLKLPADCADLVFSYVGRETKEIKNLCNDEELKVVLLKKAVTAETATVIAVRVDPTIMVSGKVLTEQQEPLIGATVIIKGTNMGTITDLEGNYSIRVPDDCATLVFNYVGLKAEELPHMCGGTTADVVLHKQADLPTTGADQGTTIFSDFKVFPNPASDIVNISFQMDVARDIELSIFTLDGKKIKTLADQSMDPGFQQFSWQPDANTKGIFQLMMIIDGKDVFKRQVVVE
jgi:TonB-dependent SusC/RagA subfamily outer membrane receptor